MHSASEHVILNRMNYGEVMKTKVTIKGIYKSDKDNKPYIDSKGNPYVKALLQIEDPSNGNKDSFYELIWSNRKQKLNEALGLGSESDVDTLIQSGNNTCFALIEKTSYKSRQTGEDKPCLKVKEWLAKEGATEDDIPF